MRGTGAGFHCVHSVHFVPSPAVFCLLPFLSNLKSPIPNLKFPTPSR